MYNKVLAISLISCLGLTQAWADDDIIIRRDTFDVAGHAVMELYRFPDKHKFEGHKWWQNISVDAYWAPEIMWAPGQYDLSILQAGIGFTKYYDKGNAMRVYAEYNSPYYKFDHPELNDQNIDRYKWGIDWLWNLTNLYWGYNREDRFNISLVTGISGGFTKTPALHRIETNVAYNSFTLAQNGKFLTATLGMQVRKFLSPNYSYFVEPRYNMSSDGYDGGFNLNNMDIYPQLFVGFSYHLTGQNQLIVTGNERAKFLDNIFLQLSPGYTSVPHPKGGGGKFSEPKSGPGLNLNFSAGKWINPAFAVRLDFYHDVYRHSIETIKAKSWFSSRFTNHLGGRVLGDYNLIYGVSGKQSLSRFGLDLLAGIEAGTMTKHNYENDVQTGYWGPAAGFQLKYFLNKNFAVFAEARYSYDKYLWPDEVKKYTDINGNPAQYLVRHLKAEKIYALNMGMEFYNTRWERYTSKNTGIQVYDNSRSPWFTNLTSGFVIPVNEGENYYDYSTITSLAGGYRLSDLQSVRARVDVQFVHSNYTKSHYHISGKTRFMLGTDYMFNLTNVMMGQDPSRNLNVELLGGPVIQQRHHVTGKDSKYPIVGGEAGAQFRGRFSDNWEIVAEPRYMFLWGDSHWTASAGFNYNWNDKDHPLVRSRYEKPFTKEYLQVLGGWQNFIIDAEYPDSFFDTHKHMMKGLYDVVFGRWLGDGFWAMQGSAFYHLNNFYRRRIVYNKRTAYYGGRLEAVFDVLHGLQTKKDNPMPLRWTVSGGVEGGFMDGIHENLGLTAATQLQYHLFSKFSAVSQIRLPFITQKSSALMIPVDVQFGLMYGGWGEQTKQKVRWHTIFSPVPKGIKRNQIPDFGYVQALAGTQLYNFDITFNKTDFRSHRNTSNPSFDFAYGHWLGDGHWGAQISAFKHDLNIYKRSLISSRETEYMGGRVEAILDMLHRPQSRRYPQPRRFKWMVSAGLEVGEMENIGRNIGFTMATQCQVRIWENIGFVAQGRLPQMRINSGTTIVPIMLQAGLQYELK